MFGSDLMWFIAGIPGILIAMVVHEYSHARVAVAMGDMTPRLMGRLTLNPKAHIDPIGLLTLFLVHFGWARPVMINPRNFRDMRKGEVLVALAGPASNLVTAFLAMLFFAVYARLGLPVSQGFYTLHVHHPHPSDHGRAVRAPLGRRLLGALLCARGARRSARLICSYGQVYGTAQCFRGADGSSHASHREEQDRHL